LHPACLPIKDFFHQCEMKTTKGSGPGGQRRNKVATAVQLHHRASGIRVVASERRSREENIKAAVFRLRIKLALKLRTKRTQVSALWRMRCQRGKVQINPKHEDFPSLLAEALDFLVQEKLDPKSVAEKLDCSSSQLLKLLNSEPRAFSHFNGLRESEGLKKLH